MATIDQLRTLALGFPGVTEEPHFNKTSFRKNGKIFATYDPETERASLKLPESDQYAFSLTAKSVIYPVDNKWGKQGWTIVEMKKVDNNLFADALKAAHDLIIQGNRKP